MLNNIYMAGEVAFVAFMVAIFAKIMQNLCRSAEFDYYGEYPLSNIHLKIAKFLKKKRLYSLLKLHYCFICQSVWYSLLVVPILGYRFNWLLWQVVCLPLLTYFFANLIIKEAYFRIPHDDENIEQ